MKRSQILLASLAAILLIAVFYVLLFQPARDEVALLELQIADELQAQAGLSQEIARLRTVREQAPEVEAELATAEAIIPRDASLPAALRQLQLAADESGVVLQAVSTTRPAVVTDAPEGLSRIAAEVQLVGGYFQVVDFLRRVEDPAISARGLAWDNATLARGEEYPELNVALSGSLYALIAVPPPPEVETPPVEGDDGTAEGQDADDAEVDVEVGTEELS